jgi:2-hydroxycyclohexanecarboxyl-CoA dehydrogenase
MRPKTAVVTGGASGIGRATCELFREKGWNVLLADRSVAPDQPHKISHDSGPGRVHSVRADVTSEDDLQRLAAVAANEFPSVDAVITCAGIADNSPLRNADTARFRHTLEVNLVSTFVMSRVFADQLANSQGAIVTIASVSGLRGSPHRAAYAASKGGVIALTRQLAVELASQQIRVNCVAPGSTSTPLVAAAQGGTETREAILRAIPLGRYAEPREVAEVVCFLAGPESSFVTGQIWGVDGGQLASAGWNLAGGSDGN